MREPAAPAGADVGQRLLCAVLAAQVAALRERIDGGATVELLWRAGDVLALLAGLPREQAPHGNATDPGFDSRRAAALGAEAELRRSLDALAFEQAQRHDLARQMADGVVTALQRLASRGSGSDRLSPADLLDIYVSDDQRRVHEVAIVESGGSGAWRAAADGSENRHREEPET
jgi:hypothetical protein